MTQETQSFADIAFTPAVLAAQQVKGSHLGHGRWPTFEGLTEFEVGHIIARDSFYVSSVGETGWPYVQHRGGDVGFVTVVDPHTIGWLERSGNRQYVSAGNISGEDRVAMIFMDYPNRLRLKVYGHASYEPAPSAGTVEQFGGEQLRNDGAITVRIAATDWNCQKYITPRFTTDEIAAITSEARRDASL